MKQGVIVFTKQSVPDKNLLKVTSYRYHPSPEMKEQIISDLKTHLKTDLDDIVIDINVAIDLKEYEVKPENKQFWYDKLKPNDTKNT